MKLKNIMLITLILLAILTIGAVSATDEISSDDLTVSNDVDIIADSDDSGDDPVNPEDMGDDSDNEDDQWDDEETYVDIELFEEENFNTTDDEDLERPFVIVSVPDELNGNIKIFAYDEDQDEKFTYFDKSLDEITTKEEDEGFIRCNISLSEINDLDKLIELEYFTVEFCQEDVFEVIEECRIEVDEENTDIIRFYIYWRQIGVDIYVLDDEDFNVKKDEDLERYFAVFLASDEQKGNIKIFTRDEDQYENFYHFNKSLDEITNKEVDSGRIWYYISLNDITDLDKFVEFRNFSVRFFDDNDVLINDNDYEIEVDEENTDIIRFYPMESDDDVSIEVLEDENFDVNNNEDLERPFVTVSVLYKFNGNIKIFAYDEDQDEEFTYFDKSLDEITNKEVDDVFIKYYISLKNITDLEKFIELRYFSVEFFEDIGEITVFHQYRIEVDEENTDIIRFHPMGSDDDVSIGVLEDENFDVNNNEDLERYFVIVSVSDELNGNIKIFTYDEDQYENFYHFNKSLDEITNKEADEGFTRYYISLNDIADLERFIEFKNFAVGFFKDNEELIRDNYYRIIVDEENTDIIRFYPQGDEVSIEVAEDEDFNVTDDEDLERHFVTVSVNVPDELNSYIRIYAYDEDQDEEIYYFDKSLDEITNKEADEGFTKYYISLKNITDLEKFIELGYFSVEFFDDDDGQNTRYNYRIEVDEENTNIIRFYRSEDDDDEEPHGEGIELEDVVFKNANALNNGVVVEIPKNVLPEDVADDFELILLFEDNEVHTQLKLSKIENTDDSYLIRTYDLHLEDIGEGMFFLLIVQFYKDGEKAYYAEYLDDDMPIHVYTSPFFFGEISLLTDDDVITFQEIPEGVDEFSVIISQDGKEDIVKTFEFPEFDSDDEVWYALKLKDLGITETGEYKLTVKFSEDESYSGNIVVSKYVDIRTYDYDDEGELRIFTSIDQLVANLRISESIAGYVNIFVNDVQVGGNISFDDLKFGHVPPEDGRQIILNNLNITESGSYDIRLVVYADDGEQLREIGFGISVEVGENKVTILEDDYPFGIEANDEIMIYTIGAPLSDGQYFNIYFNGEKAGKISANGVEFFDEFTIPMFDVKLFRPGNYNVNVTFFDGETETDITTGSFSINALSLSSDKEVYIYDKDEIFISFNIDSVGDDDSLRAFYVYGWGPVGRDEGMVFNPYDGAQMIDDGLYHDGVVSFDVGWIVDEDGIKHFRLKKGTTLIYVAYTIDDGKSLGGFIDVNVVDESELVDPALEISVDNIMEGESAVINIRTNETFTGNVLVKIGTSEYNVNVTNGVGSYSVVGLIAGNYTAIAIFEATDVFKASEKNATFTVTAKPAPVATTITATDITTTYATSKNLVVTLKDANNNPLINKEITIMLNGVSKTVKTNDKGQVSYAIGTNLIPKKYTATIKFAGDDAYTASTVSAKVTVNKAKAKMTAKKKTFKAKKKSKKYTIVLKTDKNKALKKVKVTLKVKGKTYKAKTNSKGKATFNLKKLTKKGKYTATVKFAGNKYYNAVTKKVKITVKK